MVRKNETNKHSRTTHKYNECHAFNENKKNSQNFKPLFLISLHAYIP